MLAELATGWTMPDEVTTSEAAPPVATPKAAPEQKDVPFDPKNGAKTSQPPIEKRVSSWKEGAIRFANWNGCSVRKCGCKDIFGLEVQDGQIWPICELDFRAALLAMEELKKDGNEPAFLLFRDRDIALQVAAEEMAEEKVGQDALADFWDRRNIVPERSCAFCDAQESCGAMECGRGAFGLCRRHTEAGIQVRTAMKRQGKEPGYFIHSSLEVALKSFAGHQDELEEARAAREQRAGDRRKEEDRRRHDQGLLARASQRKAREFRKAQRPSEEMTFGAASPSAVSPKADHLPAIPPDPTPTKASRKARERNAEIIGRIISAQDPELVDTSRHLSQAQVDAQLEQINDELGMKESAPAPRKDAGKGKPNRATRRATQREARSN